MAAQPTPDHEQTPFTERTPAESMCISAIMECDLETVGKLLRHFDQPEILAESPPFCGWLRDCFAEAYEAETEERDFRGFPRMYLHELSDKQLGCALCIGMSLFQLCTDERLREFAERIFFALGFQAAARLMGEPNIPNFSMN